MTDPLTPPPVEPTPPATPTEPAPAAPAYSQPPVVAAAAADFPGKTLGIVAMVLSIAGVFVWFIAPLVGAILGHVAQNQTKAFGRQIGQNVANTPAKVGIIVGWILVGLSAIGIIIWIGFVIWAVSAGLYYDNSYGYND